MSSFSVSACLKKAESLDKDIRHMALYDLNTELQKADFRIDETSQRQLAEMVLKLLADNSTDVQGMAVKCMAPLVKKMSVAQIESSIDMLCNSVLTGEGDRRDIASIAMKTVISEIPSDIASGPIKKSIGPLVKGLKEGSNEVKMECADILNDLISRFGAMITNHHETIQSALIKQLTAKRIPIRKRAITCLASLSLFTSDKLFNTFVTAVLDGIKQSQGEDLRTYIQTTSSLSRVAGYRLGAYLDHVVPLLIKNADALDKTEEVIEGEDEFREYIMQAYESFVLRCPHEVSKYIDEIIERCKSYLIYDPNYEYDESESEDQDEDMSEGGDEEDGEGPGDEEDNEFSDDEDISWKVRKASAKCLMAIITSRPDLLDKLYNELCSPEDHSLITCFREREESVKIDIFDTFIALLNQTAIQVSGSQTTPGGLPVIRQRQEVSYLKKTKGYIMKQLRKQLKQQKSVKVRTGVFRVLKELVIVLQADLKDYVAYFIPGIAAALSDKTNSTLKIECLTFLRFYLASNPPEAFNKPPHRSIAVLSKHVYNSVTNDKYYKIIAEALRVCGQLVKVIAMMKGTPEYANQVELLYNAVYTRLDTQDIDQDVKESAITTMGMIISQLGDSLTMMNQRSNSLPQCLNLLLERTKNEVTRITATKIFSTIAQSPLDIDLKPILVELVNELTSFLRKNNRVLRQSSLVALDSIIKKYGKSLDIKLYTFIINEVADLISDADLQIAHLTLILCATILSHHQSIDNNNNKSSTASVITSTIQKVILPKLLQLLQSSTLQGLALDSLLKLLTLLLPSMGFSALIDAVVGTITAVKPPTTTTTTTTATTTSTITTASLSPQRQVYANVAKAVATLCVNTDTNARNARVAQFIKDLSSATQDSTKILALYCLGEIGLRINLSAHSSLQKEIETCFESGSEEIKGAASFALGNVSVGNLNTYLPFIIKEIRGNSKRKYLLLHSLKEIVIRSANEAMKPFIGDILPLLFEYSENEEDGVRNVVAECLGKTALVDPNTVLPKLKDALQNSSENKRSTVVTAMKFTVTEKPQPIDNMLKNYIGIFVKLLNKQEPVSVRRSAVLLFTAAAHNKPSLIKDILKQVLPNLYAESFTDKSLIREVNLGPFKHKIDDGLELRKATFECLDTLLDQVFEHIEAIEFIKHMINGLSDENQDIRMLTHLMICKLAVSSPAALLVAMDTLVDPIKVTLGTKLKENPVQVEQDRHDDLLRSALRAVHAMSKIANIDTNQKFSELLKFIEMDPKLKQMFKAISFEDANEGSGVIPMEI